MMNDPGILCRKMGGNFSVFQLLLLFFKSNCCCTTVVVVKIVYCRCGVMNIQE